MTLRAWPRLHTAALLLILIGVGCGSALQAAEKLTAEQVARLLPQLFSLHLAQHRMDKAFTRRVLREYVNQLDPTRSFFLKEEAEAIVNVPDAKLEELAARALEGNFAHFKKILSDFINTQIMRDGKLYESLEGRSAEIKELAESKKKVAVKTDDKTIVKNPDGTVVVKEEGTVPTVEKVEPKPDQANKDNPAPDSAKVGDADDEDPDKIKWSERPATAEEREKRLIKATAAFYLVNKSYLSETEAMKLSLQSIREDRNKWLALADKLDEEVPKLFLKSFMIAMDPHTDYFDADEDEFTDKLERVFYGIGVQIRPCPLGAQIEDIIKGGPSEKSGKFARGDQIVAVGETRLAGMSINKIVKLIKGKEGTEVKLTVLKREKKEDGNQSEIITLKRGKIEMADMKVKGKLYPSDKGPIGVISVQSFYRDVHKDVRDRINELSKDQPLAGIVLDLRFNHGGFLEEAIGLAGLFIDKGAVVGERDSMGKIEWKDDPDLLPDYSGALVVLVNQFSASASEIVAGTLKDYNRAVIVGPTATYGKGTVQKVYPLATLNLPGEIKITTDQYFLADGASVQLKGVEPDVVIPGAKLIEEDGMLERSSDYAIKFSTIPGKLDRDDLDLNMWTKWKAENVSLLQQKSKARVDTNQEYKDAFDPKKRKAKAEAEAAAKAKELLNKPQRGPNDPPDLTDKDKEEKDVQAEEAVEIVKDMIPNWPGMVKQAAK
jgi:carboxyl-terminal processing protease